MTLLFDENLYVTIDTVTTTGVTLAWYVDYHTFGHASGYFDLNDFLALDHTFAAALMAFVLDDCAFTATGGTYALSLHHAEDTLRGVGDDTRAVTRWALLVDRTLLGTCALAVAAYNVLANLELLGDTLVDFLQSQPHLQAQVAALVLLCMACATSEASETMTAEYVAEHREDVVHIHAGPSEASEASA